MVNGDYLPDKIQNGLREKLLVIAVKELELVETGGPSPHWMTLFSVLFKNHTMGLILGKMDVMEAFWGFLYRSQALCIAVNCSLGLWPLCVLKWEGLVSSKLPILFLRAASQSCLSEPINSISCCPLGVFFFSVRLFHFFIFVKDVIKCLCRAISSLQTQ